MMKRILAMILCLATVILLAAPAYAADQSEVTYCEETVLEDGTVVKDEIIVYSQARSTGKTATRKRTFTKNDTVIAIIAFQATFRYDGSTVSVVSRCVTQTDTYEGWSYTQTSFMTSASTVTLEGKLTKLLNLSQSFSMSMSCDKNGNLSY